MPRSGFNFGWRSAKRCCKVRRVSTLMAKRSSSKTTTICRGKKQKRGKNTRWNDWLWHKPSWNTVCFYLWIYLVLIVWASLEKIYNVYIYIYTYSLSFAKKTKTPDLTLQCDIFKHNTFKHNTSYSADTFLPTQDLCWHFNYFWVYGASNNWRCTYLCSKRSYELSQISSSKNTPKCLKHLWLSINHGLGCFLDVCNVV